MKKIIFALVMIMTVASQAFAFNPDPMRYEYIGQKKSDGVYYFYEITSAKGNGKKGIIVALQADPKNRTLRYYRNTVIDPDTMTIRASYCELCDYNGNILETFNLPDEGATYKKGDLTDKIYQDLVAKGIVYVPPAYVPPVYVPPTPVSTISASTFSQTSVSKGDWKEGLTGGEEIILDLQSVSDDEINYDD